MAFPGRPFPGSNEAFWAHGPKNRHGGRKCIQGSRNGDPRFSPMHRPPHRPPFHFQRFPPPRFRSGEFQDVQFRPSGFCLPPRNHIQNRNYVQHPGNSQPGPNEQRTETPTSPKKKAPGDVEKLTPRIPKISLNSSLPTFDLQAQDMVHQCLLSPEGRREVDRVLFDLRQLLLPVISDIQPILYGSMATGLALETSDIDCFVDSRSIPDGEERMKKLLKNYRVLGRRQTFQNLFAIPKARVPLVKGVHSMTGIAIDISCTSRAALYNSVLIKRLVEADARIRPLMVLISICYRLNGLNGTNRFVSYTLALLIIFYLQNLDIPMIPPVNKIVFCLPDEQWPTEITDDVLNHVQTPNRSNLAELFSGFFTFYNSFEFRDKVISTFMGRTIPVEAFDTPDLLPNELESLKQFYLEDPLRANSFLNRFINVQDPMDHYINTTSYVQIKTLEHFQKVNSYMVDMMTTHPETSWLENMMKMTEEIPISEVAKSKLRQNPDVFFNVCYSEDELSEEEWLPKFKTDILAVFKLLLLDVVEVSKEPETKVRIADGPTHNRTLMTFELSSSFNVYTKRFRGFPSLVLSDPRSFGTATNEVLRISQQMKQPQSSFHCELSIKQPVSPREIPVQVRDTNENPANTYLHLSGMLRDNLEQLLGAAKQFEVLRDMPKEGNETVVEKAPRKPVTRFNITYVKEENEDDDAWMTRLKANLISLFEFLLLEHTDVTSTCENIAGADESIIYGFQLKSPYNLFTKRFNHTYLQVIEDPSCIPTVSTENANLAQAINPSTTGTIHCELLLLRTECLSPNQLFVALHDINQNPRNYFSHYSSMLLQNFGTLLDSFRKASAAPNEK